MSEGERTHGGSTPYLMVKGVRIRYLVFFEHERKGIRHCSDTTMCSPLQWSTLQGQVGEMTDELPHDACFSVGPGGSALQNELLQHLSTSLVTRHSPSLCC